MYTCCWQCEWIFFSFQVKWILYKTRRGRLYEEADEEDKSVVEEGDSVTN